VRYLIVGEQLASLDLESVVGELGIADAVYFTGYAPNLASFHDWLATIDVLVNLRYPTRGETSATVNRGLAAGLPVIVNDIGWYEELPDNACLKVPVQDEAALLAAMRLLAQDAAIRKEMGGAASAYARRELAPAAIAAQYAAFLHSMLEPPETWYHERRRESGQP
jgi:glycosyltransferase involved in cell wall biosynthesis